MVQIDFKDIFRRILPWFMRTTNTLRYLDAPAAALKTINTSLQLFRVQQREKVSITAQIIYLEKYLNDCYDPILKRLFIENTSDPVAVYVDNVVEARPPDFWLYNTVEQPDTMIDNPTLDPEYLFNNVELDTEIDYIIHVPAALSLDEDNIRSKVNIYNIAGKRYTINQF